jgi:hypothetical protein
MLDVQSSMCNRIITVIPHDLKALCRWYYRVQLIIIIIIIIQWYNSPVSGRGSLNVRFLDHAEGLLWQVTSSPQGGQAITLRKFLIIPDPPTRVLWQLDQQRHLVAKQGIGQET